MRKSNSEHSRACKHEITLTSLINTWEKTQTFLPKCFTFQFYSRNIFYTVDDSGVTTKKYFLVTVFVVVVVFKTIKNYLFRKSGLVTTRYTCSCYRHWVVGVFLSIH